MKPGVDYIGVGVGALVISSNFKLLLLKKTKSQTALEAWSIPGGQIEFGESPSSAIVREVYEETRLKVIKKKLIDCVNFIDDKIHWVSFVFLIKDFKGKPIIGEREVFDDIRWFDINKLPPLDKLSELTIKRSKKRIK